MWKILCITSATIILSSGVVLLESNISFAQSSQQIFTSQQFGFNLPRPPVPNGFDEVRTSDGTTCRSSIASSGPILDFGGIGSEDTPGGGSLTGATVYGRLTVQLGKKPERLDCSSLYQIELQRLQHELNLAKAALRGNAAVKENEWNNQ